MSDDEIRIAVAAAMREHCPCKNAGNEKACNWNCPCGNPVMSGCCTKCVKDYPADLNACAEMEKTLPDDNSLQGKVSYNNQLMRVCGSHAACISATARQRCESFLRVKGKWTN